VRALSRIPIWQAPVGSMASPALPAAVAGAGGLVCLLKTPNRFVRYKLAPPASTLCRDDVDCHGAAFGATDLLEIPR
jgi:hypothetical protein